jgi:hypothetical protein
MTTFDPLVQEVLDRASPERAGIAGDWPAVVRDAKSARSVRRRRRRLLAGALPVAAALALGALWPFGGGNEVVGGALAARALAAVGDGPVLHVIARLESPGWVIDLRTGRREKPYAIVEEWYEPGSGLREKVVRSNGGYVSGSVTARSSAAGSFVDVLRGFARRYEGVLRERQAEVVGKGFLYGRRVVWIRFRPERPTDPVTPTGTGYEVALDERTYRPVLVRSRGSSGVRVLSIETRSSIPRSIAAVALPDESDSLMYGEGLDGPVTERQAATLLGTPALWLGREFAGLPFAWLGGVSFAYGRAATFDEIKHRWRGINIVYGIVTNEVDGFPDRSKRYIQLREQPAAEVAATGRSTPSPGTLFSANLRFGSGAVVVNGVYIEIEAPNEQLLLAGARALEPQPAGG